MNLQQANKNIEKSKNFYRLYIKQAVEHYGNNELCKSINKTKSYIITTLKRDNTMSLYRLANRMLFCDSFVELENINLESKK
jgi:hypothetical protein